MWKNYGFLNEKKELYLSFYKNIDTWNLNYEVSDTSAMNIEIICERNEMLGSHWLTTLQ